MAKLTEIGWEEYSGLSLEAKRSYLERPEGDGMPYHTLFAQDFGIDFINVARKLEIVETFAADKIISRAACRYI